MFPRPPYTQGQPIRPTPSLAAGFPSSHCRETDLGSSPALRSLSMFKTRGKCFLCGVAISPALRGSDRCCPGRPWSLRSPCWGGCRPEAPSSSCSGDEVALQGPVAQLCAADSSPQNQEMRQGTGTTGPPTGGRCREPPAAEPAHGLPGTSTREWTLRTQTDRNSTDAGISLSGSLRQSECHLTR